MSCEPVRLSAQQESWPIAGSFTISRGSKTTADVVVVEVTRGQHRGRGECVPYPRYNETAAGVLAQIDQFQSALDPTVDLTVKLGRQQLQQLLPPGAARNAVDCALWDLESKESGQPVWRLAGLQQPQPVLTAYTISLDSAEAMGRVALNNQARPLLKLKLTGEGDLERVAAIRENAPAAALIVDANEGWSIRQLETMGQRLAEQGVTLIEQPLPAGADEALASCEHPIPICADESCHTAADVAILADRYDVVNIKLDKTGGLTEALALQARARSCGLGVMIGCMVSTSLSMAAAFVLAGDADFVDLDGPLLLQRDRQHGMRYEDSLIHPPLSELWGG